MMSVFYKTNRHNCFNKNGTHHWIVPKVSAVFFSVYVQPMCSTSRC